MKSIILFLWLVYTASISGCVTSFEERYAAHHGEALITAIQISSYDPGRDSFYREIIFDFTPHEPEARAAYLYPAWSDRRRTFFDKHRAAVSRKLVEDSGIQAGQRYPAVRYERKGGWGGVPVLFEIVLPPPFKRPEYN